MYCVRGDNGSGAEDFWGESAESIRARYEARVEELERERDEARAEALRILRLCADRPNLDHIPFQPARLEDWFNRIDNAEHQARVLPSPECSCSALDGGTK